jgi:hypothetical protein
MKRFAALCVLVVAALSLPLAGCGTVSKVTRKLGASTFTGVSVTDGTREGVVTGPCVRGTFAPLDKSQTAALGQEFEGKSVGCVLPVTRVGETSPDRLFCAAGEQEKTCLSFPVLSYVVYSGQPLVGSIWLPSRIALKGR